MTKIQVYDPALCCSTGICGVGIDQEKVTFAADVAWLKSQGGNGSRKGDQFGSQKGDQ